MNGNSANLAAGKKEPNSPQKWVGNQFFHREFACFILENKGDLSNSLMHKSQKSNDN